MVSFLLAELELELVLSLFDLLVKETISAFNFDISKLSFVVSVILSLFTSIFCFM